MLFGIRLVGDFGTANTIQRYGALAEQNGLDFVWVSHDLFKISSWVALTAVACATKRVKLGNTILNPYSCDPSELSTYITTLDELSNGRVVVGLSAGHPRFLQWVGIDAKKPLTRTKETVEILRKLFRGERVKYDGQEFHWTDQAYLRYKPFRNEIPIYIGGSGDKFLQYAGEAGDGVLPILFPPEYIDHTMKQIRVGATKAGRNLADLDIAGCVWFSVSEEGGVAEDALRALIAYYGPGIQEFRLNSIGLTRKDMEPIGEAVKASGVEAGKKLVTDKMMGLAIHGTPDECIGKIEKLGGKGVTHVALGAPLGPDPEKAIELIGRKIMPYFRDRTS
ncbi:MAG: LLM class flavin-dependent oxidoreductase [Thaumarchaeota archaeon]|nr:LLM class flavin-dependent oxidoreductase [Nitrososphaerota archaeon]